MSTDDAERGAELATVRERRSAPEVDKASRDSSPATVPMRVGDANAEPIWHAQGHSRGEILGRYVLLGLLGAGGMGQVFTAYDPALDRRIALKVIRPFSDADTLSSARGLLLAEAQALAKLSHPNVVTVYDVGTFGDDVYVAMEHVEGSTLSAWLATERTWQEIVEVFVDAGRGLAAAHAAGIVHRDFKPDNVIIGKDGRVRVIDFGIALVMKAADKDPNAGATVGTPAFMAPEQFESREVGPQTDQFSFAVCLYAALWKQHAFAGDSDFELRVNVCAGKLTEPPESMVPPAVRAAVLRALAVDPAARHPSMTELLDAIRPPPRRKVLPYAIAGGASVIAAAAVAFLVLRGQARDEACIGFERDLAGVWDPARKQAVRATVGADAWPTVERTFNTYATEWVARKVAACRATHVTREQSSAVLERRMVCLDTRRRELDAAVAIVAAPTGRSGKAIEIAGGLRALAGCDNLAALAPLPAAPTSEIHAVEDGLAKLRVRRSAGDYKEARVLAEQVVMHAERIAWGSAVARALVERGIAESLDGDPRAARESLFAAIRRGDEANDVASQAAAWIALVAVEGGGLRQPTEALRWARHAEIALAKAGGDQEQHGQLLHNIAAALRPLDRYGEALDHERRALALFEHAFGPRHVRVANQRSSVATSLRAVGKLDEAVREGEAALAMLEELVGKRHPYVASMLNNVALAYDEIGRLEDARRALERALSIREHELGSTHASMANPLMNLTSLERRAGNYERAEALWQRAFDIRVAALGTNHPDVTRALHGKLLDRMGRGLHDEARPLVDEVITRQRARPDAVELASALSQRCELQRRNGQLAAAARSCDDAIVALGSDPDPSRSLYVYAYAARVAAQRDEIAAADKLLARGRIALAGVTRDAAVARGYLGWADAHAAAAAGRRDEASAKAREARDALQSHGVNFTYVVGDLEPLAR